MQQASYLERGPLMWMLPLYLHINRKSDYDYDDMKSAVLRSEITKFQMTNWNAVPILMHLFIFSVEKMYYLHKATSAISYVKPNASQ